MWRRVRPLAAALAVCLVTRCDAKDPSRPAADSLVLATNPALRDSGLLKVLLTQFRKETNVEVTLCGASEKADLHLLPDLLTAKEPGAAVAAPDPSPASRVVLWTTLLILGPPAGAKRSYGEHNYAVRDLRRSPLGNPAPLIITTSSA